MGEEHRHMGRSTAAWQKKDCCQQLASIAERIVNDSFLSF